MQTNNSDVQNAVLKLTEFLVADDKLAIGGQLRELAKLGRKFSYADVAQFYEEGHEDMRSRLDLAFEWYEKSAYEQNDGTGFFGLGRFHFDGRHVEKDHPKALEFFHRAHMLGLPEAGVMLAVCYLKGLGTAKDFGRAEEFSLAAANLGYSIAIGILAKVQWSRRHYFKSVKLWWRCVFETRRLRIESHSHTNLYLLHGIGK